jgi:hypothetical protein
MLLTKDAAETPPALRSAVTGKDLEAQSASSAKPEKPLERAGESPALSFTQESKSPPQRMKTEALALMSPQQRSSPTVSPCVGTGCTKHASWLLILRVSPSVASTAAGLRQVIRSLCFSFYNLDSDQILMPAGHTPVSPAPREAEAGGSRVPGQPRSPKQNAKAKRAEAWLKR